MYTKDKVNRITLRLNDEQFSFVKENADFMGVSPSEFLRMVVNASMASANLAKKNLARYTAMTERIKGEGRENDKTDFDHFV